MGRLGHERVFCSLAAKDNLATPLPIFLVDFEAPTRGFLLSGTCTGGQHRADENGLYAHFLVLEQVVVDVS